ncbi:hypothetical protein AWENTII_012860 [Aspergillus wentii]
MDSSLYFNDDFQQFDADASLLGIGMGGVVEGVDYSALFDMGSFGRGGVGVYDSSLPQMSGDGVYQSNVEIQRDHTQPSPVLPTPQPSLPIPTTAPTTTSNSPSNHSTPSESSHSSRVTKRQLNTMAARRYRQKRVDQMKSLEMELEKVQRERDELKMRCSKLEGEKDAMRCLLSKK